MMLFDQDRQTFDRHSLRASCPQLIAFHFSTDIHVSFEKFSAAQTFADPDQKVIMVLRVVNCMDLMY